MTASIFLFTMGGILIFLCAWFALIVFANTPHSQFPVETDVVINEGLTLREITEELEEQHAVRSSFFTYLVLVGNYDDKFIQAGTYRFDTPQTTHEVAHAITSGYNRSPHITVTLPEGFRARDLQRYLPDAMDVSRETFEKYEGYLFPDTYFISPGMEAEDMITLLRDTFEEKLMPYEERISASGYSREEVIILASLVEREAKDKDSKLTVSGILQERLRIGMPLQVDATFDYFLGKSSDELTASDLEIDSPFNTYRYAGLPPAPIANPGLESIEAVLDPRETDYLYYLTAPDGSFYYARTFEEHKLNKERYLQ